jgi:hypothetical protein
LKNFSAKSKIDHWSQCPHLCNTHFCLRLMNCKFACKKNFCEKRHWEIKFIQEKFVCESLSFCDKFVMFVVLHYTARFRNLSVIRKDDIYSTVL